MLIVEVKDVRHEINTDKLFQIAYGLLVHIEKDDIESKANEMMETIIDESWISNLKIVQRTSYWERAKPTITWLVNDVFSLSNSEVTSDFGQYLISMTAQEVLEKNLNHSHIPLAELWKEKKSNNPGFDFHTLSPEQRIVFGEAKYSAYGSSHYFALSQIKDFIKKTDEYNKHTKELSDLVHFTSEEIAEKVLQDEYGIAAAFSIVNEDPQTALKKALSSKPVQNLDIPVELYLIGIKLYDSKEEQGSD